MASNRGISPPRPCSLLISTRVVTGKLSPTAPLKRWSISLNSGTAWQDGLWHTSAAGKRPVSNKGTFRLLARCGWGLHRNHLSPPSPTTHHWSQHDILCWRLYVAGLCSQQGLTNSRSPRWGGQTGSNWPLLPRNLVWHCSLRDPKIPPSENSTQRKLG